MKRSLPTLALAVLAVAALELSLLQWMMPFEKLTYRDSVEDIANLEFKDILQYGFGSVTLQLVKDRLQGEMLAELKGQSFTAKVDAGRAKDAKDK